MATTRVLAFTDSDKADEAAGFYKAGGYTVVRIAQTDNIQLKNGTTGEIWFSGPDADWILLIATKDDFVVSSAKTAEANGEPDDD